MKTCSVCGESKPLDEFHHTKTSKDGRTWTCRPCANARSRRWQEENRERKRESDRVRWAAKDRTLLAEQRRERKKAKGSAWQSWRSMKERCLRRGHPAWQRYGGAGIAICERWMAFENFLADMGERPTGTTLDRINSSGNYEPGNCRWATLSEQAQNRATRDTCRRGHPFDEENTYVTPDGRRQCRACVQLRQQEHGS
jgi:hypothetical protein